MNHHGITRVCVLTRQFCDCGAGKCQYSEEESVRVWNDAIKEGEKCIPEQTNTLPSLQESYLNVSEQYKLVVKQMALNTTDTFTRAMAMMFAFQEAHEEKCAALLRCQEEVHQLRTQVEELKREIITKK